MRVCGRVLDGKKRGNGQAVSHRTIVDMIILALEAMSGIVIHNLDELCLGKEATFLGKVSSQIAGARR